MRVAALPTPHCPGASGFSPSSLCASSGRQHAPGSVPWRIPSGGSFTMPSTTLAYGVSVLHSPASKAGAAKLFEQLLRLLGVVAAGLVVAYRNLRGIMPHQDRLAKVLGVIDGWPVDRMICRQADTFVRPGDLASYWSMKLTHCVAWPVKFSSFKFGSRRASSASGPKSRRPRRLPAVSAWPGAWSPRGHSS